MTTTARLGGMPDTPTETRRDLTPDGTGIVGNRHLVAVQTIDIARLTTHPVPLIPGTFIVVTGQGPKGDSNGSGKTSFESAVSLLLGDAQWRLEGNGGVAAAGLLFKPESAGLDPGHRYPPADRGYIIGVFADPDAPDTTALTVWVKIAATSPYLKARWTHGLHAPTGESDAERYVQADRLWEALPRAAEIGPKTLARELYGDAPRCMAYLETTLRKTGPSLLSQELTKLEPDEIGEALIELTGRASLLEKEETQRGLLATQKQDLLAREGEDAKARLDEQTDLDGVQQRNLAREHLARGEHLWRLHFARGWLDVSARAAELDSEIKDLALDVDDAEQERNEAQAALAALKAIEDPASAAAEARRAYEHARDLHSEKESAQADLHRNLAGIAQRRNDLQPLNDAWTGLTVEDAEAAHAAARQEHVRATVALERARRERDDAQTELDQVSAGGGGQVGAALRALSGAGIGAVGLLDALTVTDSARPVWEPRLWPYRDAVCIGPDDEPAAARAVATAGLPGSLLVTADQRLAIDDPVDGPLADGITGTVPVAGFLAALADQYTPVTDPDRARNTTVGDSVLAGFLQPIAGRSARIAAAQEVLALATDLVRDAERAETAAGLGVDAARDAADAASAHAELASLDERQRGYEQQLADLDPVLAALFTAQEEAQQAWVTAAADAQNHEQRIALARAALNNKETLLNQARDKLNVRRGERAALEPDYWADGWQGTSEAAREFLDAQGEPMRALTRTTYRNRAAEALRDALTAYAGKGGLPPDLADVEALRGKLTDDGKPEGRGTVAFSTVAQPLRDLLDARSELDQMLEDRIRSTQADRATQIEAMRTETARIDADLARIQDVISNRVETALRAISGALDGLNRGRGGYGAELRIVETRPATPTAPWKWEITPRWRRSASGSMVSYKEVANGAQVKQVAIQLVLAALLAHDGAQGRVLILDELGNSLGDVNRKQVLADLHEVAAQQNVTILGTCQDSVLADASTVCGQILWFAHQSTADAYNLPTRMWGFDANGQRVELLADWLTAGRGLV